MILIFYVLISLWAILMQSNSGLITIFMLGRHGIHPDFILLTVFYISLKSNKFSTGETFGFWTGLFEDFLSRGLLGLNAFTKTITGFLVNLFKRNIHTDRLPSLIVFIFLMAFGHEFLYLLFEKLLKGDLSFFPNLWQVGIWTALYNALIAPVLFYLYDRLFKLIQKLGKKKK